jgi:hypothetical protein
MVGFAALTTTLPKPVFGDDRNAYFAAMTFTISRHLVE